MHIQINVRKHTMSFLKRVMIGCLAVKASNKAQTFDTSVFIHTYASTINMNVLYKRNSIHF